jgi:hypothetical protein
MSWKSVTWSIFYTKRKCTQTQADWRNWYISKAVGPNSVDACFKSRQGPQLFWLRFSCVSSVSRDKFGDRFLPNSFQLINHLSSYRSTLYSLDNGGIVKYSPPHNVTRWQFHLTTWLIMNNYVFWYITPCGSLKVNRRFGGTWYVFHAGFLLGSFFDPESESVYVPPKRRLNFNGLHGVISRKSS